MKRRSRFVAGILTTVAFTLSIAGGVAASMCAADVEMAGHLGPVGMAGHAGTTGQDDMTGHAELPGQAGTEGHGGMGPRHEGGHRATGVAASFEPAGSGVASGPGPGPEAAGGSDHDCMGHDPAGDDLPHCPLGSLALGSSCAAAASLPASVTVLAASAEEALPLAAVAGGFHDLLGTTLFHPPRS